MNTRIKLNIIFTIKTKYHEGNIKVLFVNTTIATIKGYLMNNNQRQRDIYSKKICVYQIGRFFSIIADNTQA